MAPGTGAERSRRTAAVCFVLAPALLLVDNLLHPEEVEPGNEAEQLRLIADAADRWQLAHLFGFLAILILAAAVAGLAFELERRRPGAGLLGGALTILGLFGFASVIALDGFTWGALGAVYAEPGSDPATLEAALDEVQNSAWGMPFYLVAATFIFGLAYLAWAALRAGVIPLAGAILLAVAAVANGLETVIVSNEYYVAAATLLLAGGSIAANALWNLDEPA